MSIRWPAWRREAGALATSKTAAYTVMGMRRLLPMGSPSSCMWMATPSSSMYVDNGGFSVTPDDLRAWRGRLGLRQPGGARRLGVSRRALQNYEAGARAIPRPVALACRQVEAEMQGAA